MPHAARASKPAVRHPGASTIQENPPPSHQPIATSNPNITSSDKCHASTSRCGPGQFEAGSVGQQWHVRMGAGPLAP